VSSAVTSYLAAQANEQLGRDPLGTDAITGTQFTIDSVMFATAEDGKTPLAVVQAHFSGGGPLTTLTLYHVSGSVPRYSLMFMAAALLFVIHLPLLDRAEKKRKEFLTGGGARLQARHDETTPRDGRETRR
jgi:hypothetical protein